MARNTTHHLLIKGGREMTNIEKIRQEIERRLRRENEILWNAKKRGTYPSPSCEYNLLTLTSLRDFIDSLPEEHLRDSTKMISEDLEEEIVRFLNSEESTTYIDDGMLMSSYKDPHKIARHFAEWQKEQMMKDAVEGEVVQDLHGRLHVKTEAVSDILYHFGDKVKVIILPKK
jgi:hypothetical protein